MSNQNPFEGGPAGDERFMFGTFSLRANKVVLEAGQFYTEPDLLTKDGALYEFRGKRKAADGWATHTILVLKCRRRDGGEYLAFREFLYRENDAAQKIAGPALRDFFGQNLEKIWGKEVEARVEVVSFEDRGYDKQAFKVVEVFANRATREAAEQAHFAQFNTPEQEQTGAEIAEDMPWDEPEETPAPVGMPLDQAVNLLQPLWLSSGQDADKFYETLAGMPVLVPHFGSTPEEFALIPEIAALVDGQALQPEEGI